MKVRDVMITDVIVVHPDDTIREVVALSEKRQIGTFPVVDENGNLVGILTNTDLLHLVTKLLD
jgi:CBS domain-containing protein